MTFGTEGLLVLIQVMLLEWRVEPDQRQFKGERDSEREGTSVGLDGGRTVTTGSRTGLSV